MESCRVQVLLLNTYIRPLSAFIHGFGVGCHQNTSDINLYLRITKQPEAALTVLSHHLEDEVKWLKISKLKLNPGKMEVMLVTWQLTNQVVTSLIIDGGGIPL